MSRSIDTRCANWHKLPRKWNRYAVLSTPYARRQALERKQFEPIANVPDYAHDQQGPFEPPFETCHRESDMARAYEFFRERLGITIN